uniref:Uncharacterized protein n=1 Tax=Panagrellus redivivus TaxID=6233 RepID=A0A7E4V2V7_PANRE
MTIVVPVQSASIELPKKLSKLKGGKQSKGTKLPKPVSTKPPKIRPTKMPYLPAGPKQDSTKVPGGKGPGLTKVPRLRSVEVNGLSGKGEEDHKLKHLVGIIRPIDVPDESTMKPISKIITNKPIVETTTTNILLNLTIDPFPEAEPLKQSSNASIPKLQKEEHI